MTLAVDWVLQACAGVAKAHALGIVHRDLKPSNLFLAKLEDGTSVVKVLDFGISKSTNPALAPSSVLTATGSMIGSPCYMAPEQVRNAKQVDGRTDIWAIGVILYELLTGSRPFGGETLGELLVAIVEQQPAPISATRRDVPPGLEQVVARCLQRTPTQRFASIGELARALEPYSSRAGGPSSAAKFHDAPPRSQALSGGQSDVGSGTQTPPPGYGTETAESWGETGTPAPRRSSSGRFAPIAAGAGAVLLLVLVGGLGYRTLSARHDAIAPPSAEPLLPAAAAAPPSAIPVRSEGLAPIAPPPSEPMPAPSTHAPPVDSEELAPLRPPPKRKRDPRPAAPTAPPRSTGTGAADDLPDQSRQ